MNAYFSHLNREFIAISMATELSAKRLSLKVLPSKRGQLGGQLMYLLVAIILIVAVVEPVTINVVNGLNITGANASTIKTVIDLVPLLVAVLALVVVARSMGFF